ncbi:degP protease 7 [Artemisia annua]|uniref:DegP protease 7 n=1 Tax=Artemisia annua TaxID=35608 RepID=A0A2U1LZZ1_ARTAN|nr:degP protease 7 [Artemisia annua]
MCYLLFGLYLQISILAGTLARMDRDAPHYKKDGYNDFNTFYMQAASGTKGGSSGSPVVDWQGRAIALNAGCKSSSASAFFLPLERVVRALSFLQKGRDSSQDKWKAVTIPRGTLQATFVHKGFDETRRLGLQSETEQLVRHASPLSETGMLVVDSVVPGGPANKHLEPGDVVVRMNKEVLTQFLKMETLLDDNVGQNVELELERGGIPLTVQLTVQDLHSITPSYFLEISGAVIHPLSYQQARNFRFQCGLVYVSEPGYMLFRAGVPRHAIIKKFAGEEISLLEDLIKVLSTLSRGARVPLEYISYTDRHRRKSVLVTIDRHEWYASPQIYTRDDDSGLWIAKQALPDVNKPLVNGVTSMETSSKTESHAQDESDTVIKKRKLGEDQSADGSMFADGTLSKPKVDSLEDPSSLEDAVVTDLHGSVAEREIEPTLVMFEVHVPSSCMLDGVHSQHFFGTGVIIYHADNLGLIAVDKNTVAISASDIMLSFAAYPVEIPGEVVFLHPVHNYALVAYDPSALGSAGASAVRAAQLLPEPALHRGESVCLVGLSRNLQATSRKSVVTNPCAALNINSADFPRYRATNMEVIELDTDFGSSFSGVLADEQGRVKAIWGSFSTQLKYGSTSEDHQFARGIPIYSISQILKKIISGAKGSPLLINGIKRPMPLVRILEIELYPTLLSKARSFGLSDQWIQALAKKDPVRRQVLRVKGCLAGSKAENLLTQGDMVLAINKKPVTCFRDIEDACETLDLYDDTDGKLELTIFSQGREIDLLVGTDVRDGNGTTRVISWCGCYLQDPHPAVRALGFLPDEGHGVYVTRWSHGSPVHRYGLYALQWIVEVNGKPTPNLEAFVDVTKKIEDGEFVRVKTVHLNGKPKVLTLKQDLHYWPTWELNFDRETAMWQRKMIKSL